MNRDIMFVCVLFLLDLVFIFFSLREVLNDFLIGNCSKRGVRNIRKNLTVRDRMTMDFVEQYIQEEKEKKSFRRHRLFYRIKIFTAPVAFAAVLICAIKGFKYAKLVVLIYICWVIIPELIIGFFEWNPIKKCTIHAIKTHPRKQKKKHSSQ